MNSNKNILFQLSGSIACYKACDVISSLKKDGHNIKVVASASALNFVGTATLEGLCGERVYTDLFENGQAMDHINLIKWADQMVLCPASASRINSLACGIGNDLIGALFLAFDFKRPYLIFPAMNTHMYQHPLTQNHLSVLNKLGIKIFKTDEGPLACGDNGAGRLLEPAEILKGIYENFN